MARIELDSPDYQFIGVSVHGIRRMVGRRKSYLKRYDTLVRSLRCINLLTREVQIPS